MTDIKVSEEGGGGGARDAGAEILPLQLMLKTMVKQVVPLQSIEVHGGADLLLPGHVDCWRADPTGKQVDA